LKLHPLFEQWNDRTDCTGSASTPIELLVLATLKILGRDWKFDDFEDIIGVSYTTIRLFFHKFCKYGATELYSMYVKYPQTRDELYHHMHKYTQLGLNGCVGSMDATHVDSGRIPGSLIQGHSSFKSNHPARAYNITVNHDRKILYSTRGFPGRWNDKTIVRYDEFYCQILNGTIGSDANFSLYYYDSTLQMVKQQKYTGAWIIVDNGYLNRSITVPPMKATLYRDELMWSKWVESVRKDVECTFGILKGRFLILRSPSRYHKLEYMDNVWLTCCALHNMLIDEANADLLRPVNEVAQMPVHRTDNDNDDDDDDDNDDEYNNAQIDTIFEQWQAQQKEAIDRIAGMDVDFSLVNNIPAPDDPSYPNGCENIPVNKLQLKVFRSRLIQHFAISKMLGKIQW
jgi:hypothetical protein